METKNEKTKKPTSKRGLWIGGAIGLVVIVMLSVAVAAFTSPTQTQYSEAELYTVHREPLVVSVNQPGQIESRNKVIIKSLVRDRVFIEWMIDEGTNVSPGDALVKFDITDLQTKQTDQEQKRDNAKSALVAAQVSLENTTSQNESDIEQAALDVKFARLSLEKYDAPEGQFQQDLKSAQGDVELAKTTLENARNKLEWSQKLFNTKYITESELNADKASVQKAQLDMDISKGKLDLLKQYDYVEQKSKLESNLKQAEAKLTRVKNKAQADLANATIQLGTAQANLTRMQRDLDQTTEDLKNSVVTAPVAGRVVYAPQGNNWRRQEPLSKGGEVRFNQEIIHLPESGSMMATIKIDESQRDKVEVGMPVLLTGPNLPEAGFVGKLTTIGEYLDPSGWWNNNMKVYSAKADVEGDTGDLRTGMNCQTQIIVASYTSVVTVPLQAVTKVGDRHVVYMPTPTGLKAQPVEIGLDNGRKVHIISGLNDGDRVSLTPPLQAAGRKDDPSIGEVKPPNGTKPAANDKPPADSARSNARLLNRLVLMRQQGALDKLEIDASTREKLNATLDKVAAGEAAELDPAALASVRAAMTHLRSAAPKPDSDTPPANGETKGHANP